MAWYIIKVAGGLEDKLKEKIEKRVKEDNMSGKIKAVLVPKEKVREIKKGEEKVVEKKLFPGYILVDMELDKETWLYMKKIGGVSNFIGNVKPKALSDEEVQKFLSREEHQEPKLKVEFKKGDVVRIKEGPFENIEGTVEELVPEKGTIKVVAIVFGRPTTIEIEHWQLEKV
jgi:transcriptional antiterminator NusG